MGKYLRIIYEPSHEIYIMGVKILSDTGKNDISLVKYVFAQDIKNQ